MVGRVVAYGIVLAGAAMFTAFGVHDTITRAPFLEGWLDWPWWLRFGTTAVWPIVGVWALARLRDEVIRRGRSRRFE